MSVQIGGTRLSIKSDRDPAHVERLAAYIDEKVDKIRNGAPSVSMDKLLMLVSMTVAEELFEARARVDELQSSLQKSVDTCLALIDEVESEYS